jgi:uncharacterized protein involved in response to NO
MVIPIARAKPEPGGPQSTWATWTSAPHRTLFLPGALQLVCAVAFIAWEIGGRSLGFWSTPAWVVPPAWAHAYLMLFALFPWFMFGFAMTAMPKWTNVPIRRGEWLACGLPMFAGVILFHAGLATSRELVLLGGAVHLAGWLAGAVAVARIAFTSESRDPQAISISVLLFVGVILGAVFVAGMAREEAAAIAMASAGALWLFLLPIFLVVSHRMIPFFSSRVLDGYVVYRPAFSLPFLGAACAAHFVLDAASLGGWTWVADAPMAAWVGWLAWKWGLSQSFRARLLAMLHVSLSVLAAALVFSALASLAAAAGYPGLFGRGPLHLLGIGYFSAMTIAMVSRVSLGHSGRALEADEATWYGFLALIGVGVMRALADFAPLAGAPRSALLGLAAAAWIAIVVSWAARFVPLYLRPRADGRPG